MNCSGHTIRTAGGGAGLVGAVVGAGGGAGGVGLVGAGVGVVGLAFLGLARARRRRTSRRDRTAEIISDAVHAAVTDFLSARDDAAPRPSADSCRHPECTARRSSRGNSGARRRVGGAVDCGTGCAKLRGGGSAGAAVRPDAD
ncbi:MAG TPA: hypothetical protein DEP66_02870 [Acidimicrobiaceae bacterium]|nr:hypothetical protein [Acidimicrobiaceae bacterium]HCB37165.1 hypothetical protein [Acidimicrobiaceae bacterium]